MDDYLERHDITLVAGQKSYDLPADFGKLSRAMYYNQNGYSVMENYNFEELYDYRNGTEVNYLIMGDKICVYPTPTASGTVRLEYIPLRLLYRVCG